MTTAEVAAKLPFKEATEFFRRKHVDVPNIDTYTHLMGDFHDRAFMVAGGVPMDVLVDIRKLVDKAIAEGASKADFRKAFSETIDGRWEPKQERGWRADIIRKTNVSVAYSAGRYHQLKEMAETHPFWQYKHSGSPRGRKDHKDIDGMVVRADHPWWDTYYPPNGWNCACKVVALTEGQVRRKGLAVEENPPRFEIDPHWAYAPGRQQLLFPARDPGGKRPEGEGKDSGKWKDLDPDPNSDQIKPALPKIEPREPRGTFTDGGIADPVGTVRALLGGDEKVFYVDVGGRKMPVLVNAERFGGHLVKSNDDRGKYLGFLPDALEPQEVWLRFMKKVGGQEDGRVDIRTTLISAVKTSANEGLVLVTDVNSKGVMEAYTFYTPGKYKQVNKLRKGVLLMRGI